MSISPRTVAIRELDGEVGAAFHSPEWMITRALQQRSSRNDNPCIPGGDALSKADLSADSDARAFSNTQADMVSVTLIWLNETKSALRLWSAGTLPSS
jgi:hypothetical protein